NSRIIIAYAFNVTIQNTALIHNVFKDDFGALYIIDCSGRIDISNMTSVENVSSYYGGTIFISNIDYPSNEQVILIEKSTFLDNIAFAGGAIFLDTLSGSVSISECSFSRNLAFYGGGV